jgi:hypothetical protein
MQEILRRSLMEMELMHRQEELEQADLEAALAMSLALEDERQRLMHDQQGDKPQAQARVQEADSPKASSRKVPNFPS